MKIFPKLLISFLIISLLPVVLITFVVYTRFKKIEIENSILDLTEISYSRIQHVEKYLKDLEDKALIFARTTDVVNTLAHSSNTIPKETEELFHLISKVNEIENIYLINKEANLEYALFNQSDIGQNLLTGKLNNTQFQKVFSQVKISLKPMISQFDLYPPINKPAIFVGAPIFDEGNFIGVLVFQISPKEMYRIFHNYRTLGETGEILLGVKKDGQILFVNPNRLKPDAAFNDFIELGAKNAIPMQEALALRNGSGTSVDYRFRDVLAVWEYFPRLQMGVVVKIDVEEALAEINALGNLLFLISVGTSLLVVLIVIGIAKAISHPIEKLRVAANEVGSGNLDAKIDVDAGGELGELAREFKNMIDRLKNSTTSVDRLNEEIEKSQSLIQSSEELISRVSHELRTPLAPIINGIQIALEDLSAEKDQEKKELLQIAERNVQRLISLVDEIINYRQIKIEKIEEQKSNSCDINQLIKDVIEGKNQHTISKNLHLETYLDPNMPEINANEEQIKEVIESILDNAIKFTDKGSIIVRSIIKDEKIEVSIQDSGIGIEKDDLTKLFQNFRELKMVSDEKKQGFGLALARCKAIIEAHNGKIWADSRKGIGSIFSFSLPRR